MAPFQRLKFGNTRSVHRHAGKGASEQRLPHRSALNTLTKGDPNARTLGDYAKATPGPGDAPDMMDMGQAVPGLADDY